MLNKGSVETEHSFDKNDFIQQGVISSDIECSGVAWPAPATDLDEWQDDKDKRDVQNFANHSNSEETVIDKDEATSNWYQPHRKILLIVSVMVIGATLASIAIGITVAVRGQKKLEQTDMNFSTVESTDGISVDFAVGGHLNGAVTYSPTYVPTYVPTSYAPTSSSTESPTVALRTTIDNNTLTFYAMGDVPYSDMEKCLIPYELAKLSSSEGEFLVHLGDTKNGQAGENCTESLHEGVARTFESSPVPTFFVIGDNEWLDCGGGTANESLAYWKKHLLPFNNRTDLDRPQLPANVTRHSAHPEFFSFVLDNVLFLGQGLPTPRDENMPDQEEWNTYLEANANWTKEHFSANANTMRAAVIFSHSSAGPAQPYFDELKEIATLYKDIPILFLEDNHWFETQTFPQAPNLFRLKLDDTVTPVSITISK